MDEEYARYLQPLQPMLQTKPVYRDNAVTVRNIPTAQIGVYKKNHGFGRGQSAARLLDNDELEVLNGRYGTPTLNDRYRSKSAYIAAHFPDGTIKEVKKDTPLSDTFGADSYAVVGKRYDPRDYFREGETNVRNAVGYYRPDLEAYRDIEGVPDVDKRNTYAHQLINGLRSALREAEVTDEDLRSVGVNGYEDIGPDTLYKIRGHRYNMTPETDKLMKAVTAFMGSNGLYSRGEKFGNNDDLDDVTNFLRSNYRPGVYHILPEGMEERTRLYAKGGRMPKSAPRSIRDGGRILNRVGGDANEDWYL